MALRVSTTSSDIMIHDLGIKIIHPTNNRDLSLEFTAMELKKSDDLTEAIQNGDLEVDDGEFIIDGVDYDPDEALLQDLGLRGDTKYISNDELAAIGNSYIIPDIFPLSLSSTANSTRNVYAAGGKWKTWELEVGDLVLIEGCPASGDYTVQTVSDQQNFIVEETIPDSTGGTVKIYHPRATTRIGINDNEFVLIDGSNLQEALEDIDYHLQANTSSGITEVSHRNLDQLVHNIAEDSYEEFTYGSGIHVSNMTAWTDSDKTTKVREELYAWNGNRISTATIVQYDEDGEEVERMIETYTYSGIRVISIDREII